MNVKCPKCIRVNSNISIRDVAKMAQVSTAAVSKALNNKPDISSGLRKRIFAVCEKLGYRLNPSIQDLVRKGRSGTTRNIAFILVKHYFRDPAYSMTIDGIVMALRENSMHLLLDNLSGDEKTIYDLPPILRDGRIDGIVITGDLNVSIISLLKKLGVPYVILGSYGNDIAGSSVNVHEDMGRYVEKIVRGLKEAGKRRIAFFAEDPDNHYERICLDAFMSALSENGLNVNGELIYRGTGPLSGAIGTMGKVFRLPELPFDSIVSLDFRTAQEIGCLIMAHCGIGGK
ncbi:MAG: LacI family DNA-binding transcriptional regulator, partial [Lentisphaerota bacterium]